MHCSIATHVVAIGPDLSVRAFASLRVTVEKYFKFFWLLWKQKNTSSVSWFRSTQLRQMVKRT
jgi:hypothetical protein